MFCKNCGAKVKQGDAFCEQCGAPLSEESGEAQPGFCQPERHQEKNAGGKTPHRTIYIVLGSIMAVLAAAVTLEVLYLNKLDQETESYTAPAVAGAREDTSGSGDEDAEEETEEKIEVTVSPAPTAEPTPVPTETPKLTVTVQQDYIFADSSSSYLTESEVRALTPEQRSYARNEIYARHGRKFNDASLQAYFNAKAWYQPRYEAEEFDAVQDSVFNEYEKANVRLISRIEQEVSNG